AEMANYVDLDHANRVALDNLTRDLRQISDVTAFTSTAITCIDKDGIPLSITYDPALRTLTRVKSGQTKRLLEQCDKLTFNLYQRTPTAKSYDLIPAASLGQSKVLTITWSCSRKIFGRITNTEGQTAKIVIRNKKAS